MSEIVPLVLLWALSQRGSGGQSSSHANPPQWPSTHSPPPMPAFVPFSPFGSNVPVPPHGTTLPALHQGAGKAPKPKPKTASPVTRARQAATNAARQAASKTASAALSSFDLRNLMPGTRPVSVTKAVSELQTIVNTRGGALKRDGLYGPRTAAAWSALARKQGLPADISRGGPKVARVVAHTYDVLSVPPIP